MPLLPEDVETQNPNHGSKYATSTYQTMQCINIDAIGPLPTSRNGYEHILVVVDTFTRWIEIYPIRSTTSLDAARCLVQHFGRFGIPSVIRSDRGTQFVNDMIQSMLSFLHVDQQLSIAYSKEENAIVERANQEVMRHLRAFIMDKNIITDWEDYLPFVMQIMNSKVHYTTGVSPAHLLFGPQFDLDRKILHGEPTLHESNLHDYVEDMFRKQCKAIAIAEIHLLEHDQARVSEDPLPTCFLPDSYVLLDYADSEHKPHKLAPARRGPYRVIRNNGCQYEILDLVTMKPLTGHVKRLRPFNYEKDHTNPSLVANRDRQMFDVYKIHRHKGNKKRATTLTFEVEWTSYPSPTDYTMEPWSNLRTNSVLHDYLRKHGMANLIPKQFQD
jgi:hypothetical protein